MEYPNIDPVAISIGPLNIHWYGIMYLVGFALAWVLAKKRSAHPDSTWTGQQLSDLLFYTALGVILGGRVGYMLFYNFGALLENPVTLFYIWEGGMSFHGGLLGVVLALILFSRHTGKPVINVMDFIAPLIPIGLGAGRIGNFIGGELWGKPSTVPWAMEFPADPLSLPRHPSQLYEFALEGVLLFAILWWYSAKPRPAFAVSALFCLGYGVFRFIVEFFRAPDEHIGYLAFGWLTMGQVLTLPMIAVGAAVLYLAYSHNTFGRMINAHTGRSRT